MTKSNHAPQIPRKGLLIDLRGHFKMVKVLKKLDNEKGGITGEIVDLNSFNIKPSYFDHAFGTIKNTTPSDAIVHFYGDTHVNFLDWLVKRFGEDKKVIGFSGPNGEQLILMFKLGL